MLETWVAPMMTSNQAAMPRPVRIAVLVVVALALLSGYLAHRTNPYGILLYTPTNGCQARRTNAFALGYLLVIGSAAAIAMVGAGTLALSQRWAVTGQTERRHQMVVNALRAGLILLMFSGLTGTLKGLFPSDLEPKCQPAAAQAPAGMVRKQLMHSPLGAKA